ncbi:uncharacterized protein B0H64DRAFT_358759 [Chaetomium fimeti]|uniref:AA1-like domain-containing protein n=1 Tax=Chaetomium fimeti TaxID=1854472 RepID=A0AAE0HFB0_9PEZI|nr:hypothetical protein B0H64DRAFT_358759 [Chaetomium fimeti]
MRFLARISVGVLAGFAWCEPRRLATDTQGLCTNVSLSYPGWEVTDLVLVDNRIDFQLVNNADPDNKVLCSGHSTSSHVDYQECNDKQARFAYESESSILAFNQTWSCADSSLTFIGIGNTTLGCPSSPHDCSASNNPPKAILASLLAPVQLTPKPIQPPPGANTTNCTRSSRPPIWEITNLTYQRLDFGPPCNPVSGACPPGKLYYGEIRFDLLNRATGDRRACGAQYLGLSDLQAAASTTDWLACDAGLVLINPAPVPPADYQTMTYFWFDHASNTLRLNQTWYCGDLGDREEYGFVGYGAVSPALDPGVDYIGNMTVPQVRVGASAPTLVVQGEAMREKLPPYSLRRPRVFGDSCTATSLVSPPETFQIRDFWFSTYLTNARVRTGYVWMYVRNEVFDLELNFNSEGPAMIPGVDGVSDPNVWYGCSGGDSAAAPGTRLLNCSFAFDRAANRLSVREDWVCADKDNENPILFTAIASGVVAMDDSLCETSDDESENRHCPGPETFDIGVTDYSWRPCTPGDQCPEMGTW